MVAAATLSKLYLLSKIDFIIVRKRPYLSGDKEIVMQKPKLFSGNRNIVFYFFHGPSYGLT